MNRPYSILLAVALGWGACADEGSVDDSSEKKEQQELGSLTLNLTGSDSAGRQYRLRNATFLIWGNLDFPVPISDGGFPSYQTVSTETDPDAQVISLRLVPGYYQVSMENSDWFLERSSDDTWERVEQAVLLSQVYQGVYVSHGAVSPIYYRFGVDGELIDFRAGSLEIGIEIEQPGEGPPDAGFFGGLVGGSGGTGGFIAGLGGTVGGGLGGVPPALDAGVEAPAP
jgi:hypothetical protein